MTLARYFQDGIHGVAGAERPTESENDHLVIQRRQEVRTAPKKRLAVDGGYRLSFVFFQLSQPPSELTTNPAITLGIHNLPVLFGGVQESRNRRCAEDRECLFESDHAFLFIRLFAYAGSVSRIYTS